MDSSSPKLNQPQLIPNGGCNCYLFDDYAPSLLVVVAVCCNPQATSNNVLASVRMLLDPRTDTPSMTAESTRQAMSLQVKLRVLDGLNLSESRFSRSFTAGRVLVWRNSAIALQDGWQYALRCTKALELEL